MEEEKGSAEKRKERDRERSRRKRKNKRENKRKGEKEIEEKDTKDVAETLEKEKNCPKKDN